MKLHESFILFVDKNFSQLYSFAYSLIGNQRDSEKIIFDSMIGFLLESSEDKEIELFLKDYSKKLKFFFRLILMSVISQEDSLNKVDSKIGENKFFILGVLERSVVFLKHKTDLDLLEIAEVTDLKVHNVISYLQSGRKFLFSDEFTSGSFHWEGQ
jgi:DNA-directed RNA polymerase specialized sigma24 family protein